MKAFITFAEMMSPMGPLTILSSEKGICRVDFGSAEDNFSTLKSWVKKMFVTDKLVLDEEGIQPAILQLHEYFEGRRHTFTFPIDLKGTAFQQKVWEELLDISYGHTRSYKEVAQAISAPKAVRAVGGAVNKNPIPVIVPCHRVIGSNGSLVGYNGGLEKKEQLLVIENALEQIS